MNSKVSIKKNSFYNAIKTLFAIIFPLITFPYISRVLQVENVGKINFGLSIVSYFSLIASLGINAYAIRECAMVRDDRKKLEKLASQIFSINVFTTFFAYILLFIFLIVYTKIEKYRTLIILQSFTIFFTTIGTDWINSAMEDFKFITIRTVLMQVISLILMFLLVKAPDDYIKYVIVSLLASSGANIVNVFYVKKYCNISFIFDFEFNKHMKSIILMFVMLLAQTIFNNIDISMLGIMKGDYAVGIYSTAHKISSIIEQFVTSILWVIMPRMSSYFSNKDYDSINQLFTKVFDFTLTIGMPMIVGIIMLSEDIIVLFAGVSYIESYKVLIVLSMASFFTFFGGSLLGNILLLPAKREKFMMMSYVLMTTFNLVLNLFFIKYFGAIGAAFTTLMSTLFIWAIMLFRIDKKIYVYEFFKRILLVSIGIIYIVIICLLLKIVPNRIFRVLISILISSMGYFLIEYLLKNEILISCVISIKNKIKI